jgi:hypothetical protein
VIWNRDGHKLQLSLEPDYAWRLEVVCPGDCHLWASEGSRGDHDPCYVRYLVHLFGSEWLEWWCAVDGGDLTPLVLDGPFEFEWYIDDEEVRWRPVREATT